MTGGKNSVTQKLSPGAIRLRRLRERRRNGWTLVVPVEISAMDAVALRAAGFLNPSESAVDALPLALARLVATIRSRVTW